MKPIPNRCLYCSAILNKPNQKYCNSEHHKLYQEQGPLYPFDPVVDFLARLEFNTDIFETLDRADKDPELFSQFMQVPDIYVLKNVWHIIACYDPNNNPSLIGYKDNQAYINLIKWFIVKMATDPQWTSYVGHLIRISGAVQVPSSYYPVKFSPRFTPKHFFVKGTGPIDMAAENARITDVEDEFAVPVLPDKPQDAFAWKE